ncbi:MAG TPA: ATP-binding protein [Polyangiaceae bacterium LLY-WYZ-15_(1-7)]|nr:ATP-binding protein [Polyangiaceae bacterium LLY-WYZ-15_(1-7)]HJL07435.1 ATP-binding protein [Polyangiaceae bacterium LLY-WYZ-15_(1-7)]
MAPRSVSVPDPLRDIFSRAEETVAAYFAERRQEIESGTLEHSGSRYVLLRGPALSVELFDLMRDFYGEGRQREADAFSRHLLYDLAHAVGRSDARNFHARMRLGDPVERLSAGPVHFAFTGWAHVRIDARSVTEPGDAFCLIYDHDHSFEADAWLAAGRSVDEPVCIMNAGYSSGWCEASFDTPLVAAEVLCRARGDEACRFVMAPPARIEAQLARWAEGADAPPSGSVSVPDFLARKRLEEELRRKRDELEERVRERTAELEATYEALKQETQERAEAESRLMKSQRLEAIGRLAGGIAHDFNNLLTGIQGYAHLLDRELGATHPGAGHVKEIVLATERAASLTAQLLAFARRQVVEPRVLDLNGTVDSLSGLLHRIIGEEITLETELGAEVPPVRMDPGQLEQLLVNLIVNARDALPGGGHVKVATEALEVGLAEGEGELPPGRYARLVVTDDGHGMDAETRERAFEPFFTTRAGAERSGSGLGLATVHGVVRQAGGAVSLESAEGGGTRAVVSLPAADPAEDEPARPSRPPLEPAPGRGQLVLLVEDRESLRRLGREILVDAGYEVLVAGDAEEARVCFAAEQHELVAVVTDVVMPGTRGPELVEEMRRARPDLPAILVSGHVGDALEGAALPPRTAFVAKPYRPAALLRTLAALIRDAADER